MMNEQKTAPATLDDAIQSIDALEAADETRLKSYAESKIKSVESFRALPLIVGAFSLSAAAAYFVMKQIQPKQIAFRASRRRRRADAARTDS